jgi:hypothetical protein
MKYFMTSIDDSTMYCYVYAMKYKDEALNYFKRLSGLGPIILEHIFSMNLIFFCLKHSIVLEKTPP